MPVWMKDDNVRSFSPMWLKATSKDLSQGVKDIACGNTLAADGCTVEIESLTVAITLTTASLALITAFGVIGLAFFLTRSIVGPVQILATGADQFATGNLAHRIILPREDEFGPVANRFNKMAGQLEVQQNMLRLYNETLEQVCQPEHLRKTAKATTGCSR